MIFKTGLQQPKNPFMIWVDRLKTSNSIMALSNNVEEHSMSTFMEYQNAKVRPWETESKVGQKISVDISDGDINIVHRLYKKRPAKEPIVMKFNSYTKKLKRILWAQV